MVHIDDDWLLPSDSIAKTNPPVNAFISEILTPKMGADVFNYLSAMQDLSAYTEGFLSGQSVASAIYDLFGLGAGSAYNDIDIFIPYRGDGTDLEDAPEYSEKSSTYVILKTDHIGLLNVIHCNDQTLQARSLLADFDFNCVQACVNIETKELIWTIGFDDFCHTKSIEITNPTTPFHSMIRYALKRAALKESVANEIRIFETFYVLLSTWTEICQVEPPYFKYAYLKKFVRAKNAFPLLGQYVSEEEVLPIVVNQGVAPDDFLSPFQEDIKKIADANPPETVYCLKPIAGAVSASIMVHYARCKGFSAILDVSFRMDRSADEIEPMYSF